jgi:hypothetical protein
LIDGRQSLDLPGKDAAMRKRIVASEAERVISIVRAERPFADRSSAYRVGWLRVRRQTRS